MLIYFENDGSYGQNAVYRRVIANHNAIGFIQEVNDEYVVCNIFDKFVVKEQFGISVTDEQDIRAIGISY